MTEAIVLDPTRLVAAAVIGLVILLVLIIRFKVHAMISILVGAISIGLIAGMPASQIINAVNDGLGNTLKGIALLVGLGSMFGAILEVSGGAQTLAVTMVRRFGDEKAAWALGITGLVIAMPVFFDAGLIILIPLAFSLAKRTKALVSVLCHSAAGWPGCRPCVHPAHARPGARGHDAGCGSGLGYHGWHLLRCLRHDRRRSALGQLLWQKVQCARAGARRQPGRF